MLDPTLPGRRVAQCPLESRPIHQAVTQNFWGTTHFFLEVDRNDLSPSPVLHLNPYSLSRVNRLQLRSTGRTPSFSFDRGIWTCLGRCCQSSGRRQGYRHPKKAVAFTSTSWIPEGSWDQTLVHRVHTVGPIVTPLTGVHGSPNLGRLRVAELHQSAPVNNTTARRAVGKPHGLSAQEPIKVLGWFRSALDRYPES